MFLTPSSSAFLLRFLLQLSLQHEMAALIPRSSLYVIHSPHGHDSFLIEIKQLNDVIVSWLNDRPYPGLVSGSEVASAVGAGGAVGGATTGQGKGAGAAAAATAAAARPKL
jgi:hypothetical protein